MSNPETNYKGCGVVILALFILSLATNVWLIKRGQVEPEPQVVIEHDTLWRDTTIYKPAPVDSQKTGEIVYIRIPYPMPAPGDTIHDSIEVPIPIEQKRYDDSLYTAWVSGYQPALDSILLRLPTITETVTKTIVKPTPRLSLGIQMGAGIGILQHQPDIYVGIGAQYNLWRK